MGGGVGGSVTFGGGPDAGRCVCSSEFGGDDAMRIMSHYFSE